MSAWTFGDPELREALRAGRPVVALETAVLTHGLPRPRNLEAVRRMAAAVRVNGAFPAVIAVIDGQITAGLTDQQLERLANDDSAAKASARDLAVLAATGRSAGTTVAATLCVCRMLGLRVFATGGIGGVHRGWTGRPDVSADLLELARTQACVVASGAKSILDLPATLEALETLGVPVIGFATERFPQFSSTGSDDLRVPHRLDDLADVARSCAIHWGQFRNPGAVLLANPIPAAHAIPHDEMETIVEQAEREAHSRGIRGPAVTPFLLDAVARSTAGRSIEANLALLESNATLAARVAVEFGRLAADRPTA